MDTSVYESKSVTDADSALIWTQTEVDFTYRLLPSSSVTLVSFAYGVKIQGSLSDRDEEHEPLDFLDNEGMWIMTVN